MPHLAPRLGAVGRAELVAHAADALVEDLGQHLAEMAAELLLPRSAYVRVIPGDIDGSEAARRAGTASVLAPCASSWRWGTRTATTIVALLAGQRMARAFERDDA
jgi:hypothetical protein